MLFNDADTIDRPLFEGNSHVEPNVDCTTLSSLIRATVELAVAPTPAAGRWQVSTYSEWLGASTE